VCVNKQETDIKIIDFGLAKRIEQDKEVKLSRISFFSGFHSKGWAPQLFWVR
jgi:hypothetical protein